MPLTDTYGQGVPYSTLTDKPNIQTLGQGLVNGMVPKLVMTFTSAVVRGATIGTPTAGMVSYLKDVARLEVFDGDAWVTVAAGTSTWQTFSLSTSFVHNGNLNGTAQWRLVNLFGEQTLMLRGGIDLAYNGSGILNGGVLNVPGPLPVAARPSNRRTITVACSMAGSDIASLKLDINTDGQLVLVGTNTTTVKPAWVSLNGTFASL